MESEWAWIRWTTEIFPPTKKYEEICIKDQLIQSISYSLNPNESSRKQNAKIEIIKKANTAPTHLINGLGISSQ